MTPRGVRRRLPLARSRTPAERKYSNAGPEAQPVGVVGVDAFGKPQAHEEFLFAGIGRGFFASYGFAAFRAGHIVLRRFHVLPSRDRRRTSGRPRRIRHTARVSNTSNCESTRRRGARSWKSRSDGCRGRGAGRPPFHRSRRCGRPRAHRPRRSACRPAEFRRRAGCRRRPPAYRRKRAAGRDAMAAARDSAQLASVWPGSPAMRSILMLWMPCARSRATSCATISAVCFRPVRASSCRMNDCTPRLTRLMPARSQASTRSAVSVPGAASIVASRQWPGQRVQQANQMVRFHPAGSSAAKVESVRRPLPGVRRRFLSTARRDSGFPIPAAERPTRNCNKCTSGRKTATRCRCLPLEPSS